MTDYSSIPPVVLQRAAERGTAVHEAIAGVITPEQLPSQWHGYLKAARRWEEVNLAKYAWHEERFFNHEIGITGQLDALMVRPTRLVLIDWKTPVVYSPSWDIQMNAYMKLLEWNGCSVEEAWVVQLSKNGTYTQTIVQKDPAKWTYFLTLLSIYKETPWSRA